MATVTTRSAALVPHVLNPGKAQAIALVLGGAAALAALAQVAFLLPFTPVMITGQTFGVTLLSLLLGRKLGMSAVFTYLLAGALGMPVFAGGLSGLSLGPTMGYLVGMLASSYVVGGLADRGAARGFWRTACVGFAGSFFVYAFGLMGLSYFVPADRLLVAGVLPFIPGDVVKTLAAAAIASGARRAATRR